MMKIGILTHPLGTNYGGILQNYALQTFLKKMGHEVLTIYTEQKKSKWLWFKSLAKYVVKKVIRWKGDVYAPMTSKQKAIINRHTKKFIDNFISTTHPMFWVNRKIHKKYMFDAYIVGSDQVWRPNYVHRIEDMYFNFLKNINVKKIAYAASFGKDTWEYSKEQEFICSKLVKNLDYVSVREKSGISLCEKYLKVKATHVLDPTMLLSKQEYKKFIITKKKKVNKQLTIYILDLNDHKKKLIDYIASKLHFEVKYIGNSNADKLNKNYLKRIAPPVEDWLTGIWNADFVVTDSFHGTVFSIIFNKQFLCIGNIERGFDRFYSLLEMLYISGRLLNEKSNYKDYTSQVDSILNTTIDYTKINEKLSLEKNKSINYLYEALS